MASNIIDEVRAPRLNRLPAPGGNGRSGVLQIERHFLQSLWDAIAAEPFSTVRRRPAIDRARGDATDGKRLH